MESAVLAGGRAVGVKAIGSVLGNGLTRNGRLKAMPSRSRGYLERKASFGKRRHKLNWCKG